MITFPVKKEKKIDIVIRDDVGYFTSSITTSLFIKKLCVCLPTLIHHYHVSREAGLNAEASLDWSKP